MQIMQLHKYADYVSMQYADKKVWIYGSMQVKKYASCTLLFKDVQGCTLLYNLVHPCTSLHKVGHYFTTLYMVVLVLSFEASIWR